MISVILIFISLLKSYNDIQCFFKCLFILNPPASGTLNKTDFLNNSCIAQETFQQRNHLITIEYLYNMKVAVKALNANCNNERKTNRFYKCC